MRLKPSGIKNNHSGKTSSTPYRKNTAFLALLFLMAIGVSNAVGQQVHIPPSWRSDSLTMIKHETEIAKRVLPYTDMTNSMENLETRMYLYNLAQQHDRTLLIIDTICHTIPGLDTSNFRAFYFPFRIHALSSKELTKPGEAELQSTYISRFREEYSTLTDYATTGAKLFSTNWDDPGYDLILKTVGDSIMSIGADSVSANLAITWSVARSSREMSERYAKMNKTLLKEFELEKFVMQDSILLKMNDGGTVTLTIARLKKMSTPAPVILLYNIYAGNDALSAQLWASKGYVCVVAAPRGKRLSMDETRPLEFDGRDGYEIIDWISRQSWCNGKVGMWGGSYLGFAQWSTVKKLHPALKTIVPQVAVGAGIDFPVQNGIFMNYMLQWIHYVTNNKTTDEKEFHDQAKWDSLYARWYRSGLPYRKLDSLEGRPNKIFQRWLDHPSYDDFWKAMTPQREGFAAINIPILTITGYWDDDQTGAMYYYRQHHTWNKNANHYLLIGPWNHFGSQGETPSSDLLGYGIDSVAMINISDVVKQWFDYILKDSTRPEYLKDKVNFEVMGMNSWKNVSSLDKMSNDSLILFLGTHSGREGYPLTGKRSTHPEFISQKIDFRDRSQPFPPSGEIQSFTRLVDTVLHPGHKMVFRTGPIPKDLTISGNFTASFDVVINKKDVDLVVDLYAQMPDGRYIALSDNFQRASYAENRSSRKQLQPGKMQTISMKNTFISCMKLPAGSQIILLVDVNNDPHWQINYGTGKDVSGESIEDGKMPLDIRWYNSSRIFIPLLN